MMLSPAQSPKNWAKEQRKKIVITERTDESFAT